MMSLFDVLVRLQSFLVGIIGFSGVILTLWWNARQSKLARRAAKDHERESTRIALAEELKYIESHIIYKLQIMDEAHGVTMATVSVLPQPKIYHALIKEVGLLTPRQAGAVIRAYAVVENVDLDIRQKFRPNEDIMIPIPGSGFDIAKMFYSVAVESVQSAIVELSAGCNFVPKTK